MGQSIMARFARRNAKRILKATCCVLMLLFMVVNCSAAQQYAIGADVSFLKAAEDHGKVFKDHGKAKPGLEILKAHQYNWIRLRLFHTPTDLPNDLAYTLAEAKAAKKLGFRFLLDFHYSDTWADPGKQFTPRAWEKMSHPELVKAVFDYTRQAIASFQKEDAMPDMVQIGNEVINGMLWPDGRLPANWDNFADLIKAGIAGVQSACGGRSCPQIMIHIDRGGDPTHTKEFFDKLNTYQVAFDVIGQSYYPWWHGGLDQLRDNMAFMAHIYHKDIIVVETAYNWRPAEYIQKAGPFPETPEGQKQFLQEVNRVVQETPDGRGKGIFWWEPAVTGPLTSRGFFDDQGNALPVLTVFDRPVHP